MTYYSTKRNTFILKCFLQFTCTSLDASQKDGGNFFKICFRKRELPRIGGVPSEKRGSNPGGNYDSNMFLLTNLQNIKLVLRKYCSKGYLFWYHCATLDRFFLPLNIYFNDMQIFRWLHLSSSLWGIPLHCNLLRKSIDQKNFFF